MVGATRTKARGYVDLVTIDEGFSSLGPLVLAASGKPPNFSPQKIIEEIRRRSHSAPDEDYLSVRGLPPGVTAPNLRDRLTSALDRGEAYIRTADLSLVGALSVDEAGKPVAALGDHSSKVTVRRATDDVQAVPTLRDEPSDFERG